MKNQSGLKYLDLSFLHPKTQQNTLNMFPLARLAVRTRVYTPRTLLRVGSLRFQSHLAKQYQEKLEQKAKELGLKDSTELKTHLKEDIERIKKELNVMDPLKELEEYERRQAAEIDRERSDAHTIKVRKPVSKLEPKAPYKTMESYIDVTKVLELPKDHVEFIWRARFELDPRNLHALLTSEQFAKMYANAFKNPSFILPLPKGDGYEMHFVQWQFVGPKTTHCMITTVAEYKLHKEYAKPHTSITFHQELVSSKDLVLMNGYCETESSLSMDEAQLLVLNVQRFYGGVGDEEGAERRQKLLLNFTSGTENFDMEALVKEATSFE